MTGPDGPRIRRVPVGPPVGKPGDFYGSLFDIVKRKGYAGGGVLNYMPYASVSLTAYVCVRLEPQLESLILAQDERWRHA